MLCLCSRFHTPSITSMIIIMWVIGRIWGVQQFTRCYIARVIWPVTHLSREYHHTCSSRLHHHHATQRNLSITSRIEMMFASHQEPTIEISISRGMVVLTLVFWWCIRIEYPGFGKICNVIDEEGPGNFVLLFSPSLLKRYGAFVVWKWYVPAVVWTIYPVDQADEVRLKAWHWSNEIGTHIHYPY